MSVTVEEAGTRYGVDWFSYQVDCFTHWQGEAAGQTAQLERLCVYYPTGKGKTMTMLTCVALRGYTEAVVIAPPIIHHKWVSDGLLLGITVTAMSHAKFRMADTKLSRNVPLIADEFHLFGGQTGQGWKKLDRLAAGLRAPLILGSATPNYNDAERVYCISHVLDPFGNRGGYLQFLYQHCTIETNPFGAAPIVTGFLEFPDAEAFLASLPGVVYLPDDAPDILVDLDMSFPLEREFDTLGLDRSRNRIMASLMEKRHRRRFLQIVDPETGGVREHIYEMLSTLVGNATTPTLIFCARSTVARALGQSLDENFVDYGYIDGKTSLSEKTRISQAFKDGQYEVLIGTATLATGTDGIDTMCDELVILDDTDDDSLRRQLVGRILPRGAAVNYAGKYAHRFIYDA